MSPPQAISALLISLQLTRSLAKVTKSPCFHRWANATVSLLVSQLLLIPSPASTQLPACPSDCKLEYIPPLAKTVPWHPSFLHFDVHTPPQDLAPAHLSNLTSFLPPPTHPVSATSAFFPLHDCAKPLSTPGPELFLVFCLEQPFFPQLFTRWLIPFLRGQLTCQLLTRKLAYQAVKSSPFLTPDNYTSPSLPPIIFICF